VDAYLREVQKVEGTNDVNAGDLTQAQGKKGSIESEKEKGRSRRGLRGGGGAGRKGEESREAGARVG